MEPPDQSLWQNVDNKQSPLMVADSAGKGKTSEAPPPPLKAWYLLGPRWGGAQDNESCENIHSWISQVGGLASSRQGGIYGFKFPKRFFGDLFQRSHSLLTLFLFFVNPNHQKELITNLSVPFSFAFARLNALQAAVRHNHSLSDPESNESLEILRITVLRLVHKQIIWLRFEIFVGNHSKR